MFQFRMKVEVKEATSSERSGVSQRTGQPYRIRTQAGYAHMGKPYPVEIPIQLDENQPPYAPGEYTVTEESIGLDKYGKPCFLRIKLQPLRKAA